MTAAAETPIVMSLGEPATALPVSLPEAAVTPLCHRTIHEAEGDRSGDAALAAGFRDGDEGAVREVVQRYGGAMTLIARSLLADRHRADDAVQQAFLQAWRAAATFDATRPLGPWLFTITRRACIDLHRRDRRAPVPDSTALSYAEPAVEPPSVEALHARWEVRRVLDELPTEERVVVKLQHHDGLSHREIADRLRLPLGTVKSRSWRAHRRLAKMLTAPRPRLAGAYA